MEFDGRASTERLGMSAAWQISDKGHDGGPSANFMWRRAAALMESGIYGIWKKWDDMRRSAKLAPEAEHYVVALSLGNSDIRLQFYLFLMCTTAALMALTFEVVNKKKFDR